MWMHIILTLPFFIFSSNGSDKDARIFSLGKTCTGNYRSPGLCINATEIQDLCVEKNMRILPSVQCPENYLCCMTLEMNTNDNSTNTTEPLVFSAEGRQLPEYANVAPSIFPPSIMSTCGKRGGSIFKPAVQYPTFPPYPGLPNYPGIPPYPVNPNLPFPPYPTGDLPIIPRIAGGALSNDFVWCWQAAIMDLYGHYICGGVLVAPNFVLTAAHCVEKNAPMKIRLGDSDLNTLSPAESNVQEARVYKIIRHPYYNPKTLDYDVALLQLTDNVQLTGYVCLVCLPPKGMDFYGQNCIVTGYGKSTPNENFILRLKELAVPVISYTECEAVLQKALPNPYFKLARTAFCAGGNRNEDACEGDGGSPLICADAAETYYVSGLVSWGVGCGKVPGVYTAVPLLVEWISAFISAAGSVPVIPPPSEPYPPISPPISVPYPGTGLPLPTPPTSVPYPPMFPPSSVPYPQLIPSPNPLPNPFPNPNPVPYPTPMPNVYSYPNSVLYPTPIPNQIINDGSLPIVPRNQDTNK